MAAFGWLAAVRITADEAEYHHAEGAKNDGKEDHRRREPEYLLVPSPPEIEPPIAEGCDPYDRYEDHERPEDKSYGVTLT